MAADGGAGRRGGPGGSGCQFCEIVTGTRPAHVVDETEATLAFLDHRPVFPGHVLLVPRRHVVTLPELPDHLVVPLFTAARRIAAALEGGFGAQGSFVAVNNRVSQSVAHLHVHLVPRRFKDGLRGFFWPRRRYAADDEAAAVAAALRAAIEAVPELGREMLE